MQEWRVKFKMRCLLMMGVVVKISTILYSLIQSFNDQDGWRCSLLQEIKKRWSDAVFLSLYRWWIRNWQYRKFQIIFWLAQSSTDDFKFKYEIHKMDGDVLFSFQWQRRDDLMMSYKWKKSLGLEPRSTVNSKLNVDRFKAPQ